MLLKYLTLLMILVKNSYSFKNSFNIYRQAASRSPQKKFMNSDIIIDSDNKGQINFKHLKISSEGTLIPNYHNS
jgi:hypothetical protein